MSKLALNDILSAVDQGGKDIWDLLDDEQRKQISFFLLNRYVSSVKSSKREIQEYFVLSVNENFNKNFFSLNKHPKLLWQLLCCCSHPSKQSFYHEWIGFKKKAPEGKKLKFLQEFYPQKKIKDLEMMAEMNQPKDLKQLAIDAGWDDKRISKFF